MTPVAAPIKALIFDMGGVLEPPFDDILMPALADMLGVSRERLQQLRGAHGLALTEGRMTLRDFYAGIIAESGRPVLPDAVVARHLAVYETATGSLDARVLGLIRRLQRRHVVACLTNTEVEVGRFNRERGWFGAFDRAFLSTELRLHKPERAIFGRVLADLDCAAAEALFTDDKLDNVVGARAAGLHAIHYRDFEAFSRELARLIELAPDA